MHVNELFVPWAISAVIGIGPIVEIVVFPLIGMLNDRIGTKETLLLGGITGVIYFILLSFNTNLFLLLLIQIFGTLYTAVLYISLMIYVQDTFKERTGFASSFFFSGMSLSMIIGNAILGSVLLKWGYNVGFLLLAGLTMLGVMAIIVLLFNKNAFLGLIKDKRKLSVMK